MGVPDDRSVIVVAVRAQRLAEARVGLFVPVRARQATTMRADGGFAAWTTTQNLAARTAHMGMNEPERRRGEGDEDGRMGGDIGRDAFATVKSCLDDLVRVT